MRKAATEVKYPERFHGSRVVCCPHVAFSLPFSMGEIGQVRWVGFRGFGVSSENFNTERVSLRHLVLS